jgi:RNaseH domain of pPIWI_RE
VSWAPVQYLRPEQEDGQWFRWNQNPSELFETRLLMAWLDLAWKTMGRVNANKLAAVMAQVYGSAPTDGAPAVLPPDRVLAVGILRRNRTRLANEKSFVPFAIELDVERGTCFARFAHERGQGYETTQLLRLPEALVALASSGPIQLATTSTNRREQLQERSQHFFHAAITDFCQRAERPLILIDAVACRDMWPWLADTKIDPQNVVIGQHPHKVG